MIFEPRCCSRTSAGDAPRADPKPRRISVSAEPVGMVRKIRKSQHIDTISHIHYVFILYSGAVHFMCLMIFAIDRHHSVRVVYSCVSFARSFIVCRHLSFAIKPEASQVSNLFLSKLLHLDLGDFGSPENLKKPEIVKLKVIVPL